MNDQVLTYPRTHHLYVAISKFLFHHPEYGIVYAGEPIRIKDAEYYKLSPLILYGLTIAGLPIRWMTFSMADEPRALLGVLQEAWLNADGLRGQPDILLLNYQLATSAPDLVQQVRRMGISVIIADAKDKSLPASLRSAQNSSKWLLGKYSRQNQSSDTPINALCKDSQYDHDFHAKKVYRRNNIEDKKIQKWLSLPKREVLPITSNELDWNPGSWLSSWELSLPPNPSRYFRFNESDKKTWLITGESESTIENAYFEYGNYYNNIAEIAKKLLACWPNPPIEVARCIGVTLKELQWFISGKTSLESHAYFALEDILGIEYDERTDNYVANGPYVLMAQKPLALKEVYDNISKGGDAHPCEIVPRYGIADPSWRYILINTYVEPPSFIMFPRGSRVAERMSSILLNFSGTISVSPELYRDVVSTCAKACREPLANIREMKSFAKRYEKHWSGCSWEPGELD